MRCRCNNEDGDGLNLIRSDVCVGSLHLSVYVKS